jgi:DNA-binding IclR family transcriptional regulator
VTKPLTALEDATLRFILGSLGESDGWLDLTRICSRTGRHLGDVRQAVARLVRRRLISVDERAGTTERWLRFVAPGAAMPADERSDSPVA